MNKTVVSTNNAPAAIGPYSQAVKAGSTLYVSGQIPIDPATGSVIQGGIAEQTHMVFLNLKAILAQAGMTFDNVVHSTVLLTNISEFSIVNEIYGTYIQSDVKPARATFQVSALPKNADIEIGLIAQED